jgi:hypothetical protein
LHPVVIALCTIHYHTMVDILDAMINCMFDNNSDLNGLDISLIVIGWVGQSFTTSIILGCDGIRIEVVDDTGETMNNADVDYLILKRDQLPPIASLDLSICCLPIIYIENLNSQLYHVQNDVKGLPKLLEVLQGKGYMPKV